MIVLYSKFCIFICALDVEPCQCDILQFLNMSTTFLYTVQVYFYFILLLFIRLMWLKFSSFLWNIQSINAPQRLFRYFVLHEGYLACKNPPKLTLVHW